MKCCMFCNREHYKLFGSNIKYCELCKKEIDDIEVKVIANRRSKELKIQSV